MAGEAFPRRTLRPWGLRGLRPAPAAEVPVYRYDLVRQVALSADGELWVTSEQGKQWCSIFELDGDEGRSEQWGWDDDGKDVTEGV